MHASRSRILVVVLAAESLGFAWAAAAHSGLDVPAAEAASVPQALVQAGLAAAMVTTAIGVARATKWARSLGMAAHAVAAAGALFGLAAEGPSGSLWLAVARWALLIAGLALLIWPVGRTRGEV